MLPKRKPKKKRREAQYRDSSHIRFVKQHACCRCGTFENIEAAHVRTGTDGGMSVKPSDYWTISLCSACHQLQHNIGEPEFEVRVGWSMKDKATEFANASPKRLDIIEHRSEFR